MNSIEIDDDVLAELSKRAVGFNVTPNLVIRRILGLPAASVLTLPVIPTEPTPAIRVPLEVGSDTATATTQPVSETQSMGDSSAPTKVPLRGLPLSKLVDNRIFQDEMQSIDRFTSLLTWAYAQNPEKFTEAVAAYQRGNRCYFGSTRESVESSGKGIKAKEIQRSPFWVLATLDNKAKRSVIEEIFRALGHSLGEVSLAKAQLADTDIKRRRTYDLSILNLAKA